MWEVEFTIEFEDWWNTLNEDEQELKQEGQTND